MVEADRLAKAGVVLDRAIRSCGGASGVVEAKSVAAESARVGKQLAAASTEGQVWDGATIARRGCPVVCSGESWNRAKFN